MQPFTSKEVAIFQRRKEEGYDIVTDVRYNCWLSSHSKSTLDDPVQACTQDAILVQPKQKTTLAKVLENHAPLIKYPDTAKPKSCARVVTSKECREEINEKHRQKLEEQRQKEERKIEREKKRMEKIKKTKEGKSSRCLTKYQGITLYSQFHLICPQLIRHHGCG